MVEGVLDDLGGAGAQEVEIDASSGVGSDAVAMAAALGAAQHDPELAGKLGGYVDRQAELADHQTRLIRLQTEHLHEQRELTLSHMRWRRFSDRMKAVLQVMTAAVGLAIAVGVGGMALSASQERGLVIQPFSVPPDMAARGLSGQVVASMLLDRLGRMQSATRSARAASTFANNWNDEIKVEIPETGVSIGELQRLLIHWLGHQTTISGDVYRTATGIAVSARTGESPANPHEGADADIGNLVQQAAQDVFAASQPYRYAIYLETRVGDVSGAKPVLEKLARTGDRTDRIWAYSALSNLLTNQGDFQGAIRASDAAIQIDPEFPLPYANRGVVYFTLGRIGPAAADGVRASQLVHRSGSRYMKAEALAYIMPQSDGTAAAAHGDLASVVADDLKAVANPGQEDTLDQLALDQIRIHEVSAARASMKEFATSAGTPVAQTLARKRYVDEQAALELQDWPGAWNAYAAMDTASLTGRARERVITFAQPDAAFARAMMGDIAGARTLVATTPADCYQCVLDRARIEAAAGNAAGADRWFAEAVRQAPTVPTAYQLWGRALLDRGDVAGAIARLEAGSRLGPRFADTFEVWGEALVRSGDYDGAATKFAEADRHAPRWGKNHLRWGEALLRAGRYRKARAQFEAADGLDLSRPDRAALDVLLARTASGPLHG